MVGMVIWHMTITLHVPNAYCFKIQYQTDIQKGNFKQMHQIRQPSLRVFDTMSELFKHQRCCNRMGCDLNVFHHDKWCKYNKFNAYCTFLLVMEAC